MLSNKASFLYTTVVFDKTFSEVMVDDETHVSCHRDIISIAMKVALSHSVCTSVSNEIEFNLLVST